MDKHPNKGRNESTTKALSDKRKLREKQAKKEKSIADLKIAMDALDQLIKEFWEANKNRKSQNAILEEKKTEATKNENMILNNLKKICARKYDEYKNKACTSGSEPVAALTQNHLSQVSPPSQESIPSSSSSSSMTGLLPPQASVPPAVSGIHPATLPNAKNATVEPVNTSATVDATPTEEDGTSVSLPSVVQKSAPNSVPSTSAISSQAGNPTTQFNPMLNLPNNNRFPIASPVSTTGAPIPDPPPQNVRLNVSSPGMTPNSQFPEATSVGPYTLRRKRKISGKLK